MSSSHIFEASRVWVLYEKQGACTTGGCRLRVPTFPNDAPSRYRLCKHLKAGGDWHSVAAVQWHKAPLHSITCWQRAVSKWLGRRVGNTVFFKCFYSLNTSSSLLAAKAGVFTKFIYEAHYMHTGEKIKERDTEHKHTILSRLRKEKKLEQTSPLINSFSNVIGRECGNCSFTETHTHERKSGPNCISLINTVEKKNKKSQCHKCFNPSPHRTN